MAVVHSPESEFSKEMVKWEASPTVLGPGLRPYVKRLFPMMLYRAERIEGQIGIAETFVAESEAQRDDAQRRGFADDPLEAFERVTAQELEIAKLAANRAYQDQGISARAQAEVATAEAATSGHLASMPMQPIRRRGRPLGSGRRTIQPAPEETK